MIKRRANIFVMASYTDKGNGNIKPITQHDQVFLRYYRINAEEFDEGSSILKLVTEI